VEPIVNSSASNGMAWDNVEAPQASGDQTTGETEQASGDQNRGETDQAAAKQYRFENEKEVNTKCKYINKITIKFTERCCFRYLASFVTLTTWKR
jgi:fibronectin type 3 domain-containing protein